MKIRITLLIFLGVVVFVGTLIGNIILAALAAAALVLIAAESAGHEPAKLSAEDDLAGPWKREDPQFFAALRAKDVEVSELRGKCLQLEDDVKRQKALRKQDHDSHNRRHEATETRARDREQERTDIFNALHEDFFDESDWFLPNEVWEMHQKCSELERLLAAEQGREILGVGEASLRVEVSEGMFPESECSVAFRTVGEKYSLFVDKVHLDTAGHLKVTVLACEDGAVLIQLPSEVPNGGSVVAVPDRLVLETN